MANKEQVVKALIEFISSDPVQKVIADHTAEYGEPPVVYEFSTVNPKEASIEEDQALFKESSAGVFESARSLTSRSANLLRMPPEKKYPVPAQETIEQKGEREEREILWKEIDKGVREDLKAKRKAEHDKLKEYLKILRVDAVELLDRELPLGETTLSKTPQVKIQAADFSQYRLDVHKVRMIFEERRDALLDASAQLTQLGRDVDAELLRQLADLQELQGQEYGYAFGKAEGPAPSTNGKADKKPAAKADPLLAHKDAAMIKEAAAAARRIVTATDKLGGKTPEFLALVNFCEAYHGMYGGKAVTQKDTPYLPGLSVLIDIFSIDPAKAPSMFNSDPRAVKRMGTLVADIASVHMALMVTLTYRNIPQPDAHNETQELLELQKVVRDAGSEPATVRQYAQSKLPPRAKAKTG